MAEYTNFYNGTIPEIKTERFWSTDDVRRVCVGADLYTCGTIRDYEKMLKMVEDYDPDPQILYMVAKDIYDHSDQIICDIPDLMHLLENEAIWTTFEVL